MKREFSKTELVTVLDTIKRMFSSEMVQIFCESESLKTAKELRKAVDEIKGIVEEYCKVADTQAYSDTKKEDYQLNTPTNTIVFNVSGDLYIGD